ncbi:hypothetical protein PM082_001096 [Marasmius tenuissimus]|nr:hypothetical protein PM082_001096 [Marasmius tenuissimus]
MASYDEIPEREVDGAGNVGTTPGVVHDNWTDTLDDAESTLSTSTFFSSASATDAAELMPKEGEAMPVASHDADDDTFVIVGGHHTPHHDEERSLTTINDTMLAATGRSTIHVDDAGDAKSPIHPDQEQDALYFSTGEQSSYLGLNRSSFDTSFNASFDASFASMNTSREDFHTASSANGEDDDDDELDSLTGKILDNEITIHGDLGVVGELTAGSEDAAAVMTTQGSTPQPPEEFAVVEDPEKAIEPDADGLATPREEDPLQSTTPNPEAEGQLPEQTVPPKLTINTSVPAHLLDSAATVKQQEPPALPGASNEPSQLDPTPQVDKVEDAAVPPAAVSEGGLESTAHAGEYDDAWGFGDDDFETPPHLRSPVTVVEAPSGTAKESSSPKDRDASPVGDDPLKNPTEPTSATAPVGESTAPSLPPSDVVEEVAGSTTTPAEKEKEKEKNETVSSKSEEAGKQTEQLPLTDVPNPADVPVVEMANAAEPTTATTTDENLGNTSEGAATTAEAEVKGESKVTQSDVNGDTLASVPEGTAQSEPADPEFEEAGTDLVQPQPVDVLKSAGVPGVEIGATESPSAVAEKDVEKPSEGNTDKDLPPVPDVPVESAITPETVPVVIAREGSETEKPSEGEARKTEMDASVGGSDTSQTGVTPTESADKGTSGVLSHAPVASDPPKEEPQTAVTVGEKVDEVALPKPATNEPGLVGVPSDQPTPAADTESPAGPLQADSMAASVPTVVDGGVSSNGTDAGEANAQVVTSQGTSESKDEAGDSAKQPQGEEGSSAADSGKPASSDGGADIPSAGEASTAKVQDVSKPATKEGTEVQATTEPTPSNDSMEARPNDDGFEVVNNEDVKGGTGDPASGSTAEADTVGESLPQESQNPTATTQTIEKPAASSDPLDGDSAATANVEEADNVPPAVDKRLQNLDTSVPTVGEEEAQTPSTTAANRSPVDNKPGAKKGNQGNRKKRNRR